MFVFLAQLFLSCNDNTLIKVVDVKPEIVVHPQELYYDHVRSGFETEIETFSIMNVGNAPLHVNSQLMDGSNRFAMNDHDDEQFILQPGEILDVPIEYAPITYEHNGAVVKVLSNDEENPELFVMLEGYGDAPKIVVDPEHVDYGDISIGCDNEYRITISNQGNIDLEISQAIQMTTLPNDIVIEYGSLPDTPWTIIPEEQIDLLIKYTPTDIGYDDSVIAVASNDPANPLVELTQKGYGDVEHWIIDEWIQDDDRVYDIIWVIDNSGSMLSFQNSLITNMNAFFNIFFAQQDIDYRMGFITTDRHILVANDYIDINTPDPVMGAMNILSMIGVGGNGTEKGLQKLDMAMDNFLSTGTFMRPDANFVAIFLSDEPDNSFNSYTYYIQSYNAKKDPSMFKPYGIIGDYPSGCTGIFNNQPKTAQYGAGYYELINYYGGDWFSICEPDWATSLANIAEDIVTRSRFPLSKPDPIVDTIEVYINSQLTTSGWQFNQNNNEVVFDANNIPTGGQTIRIEYATYGCGEIEQ